MSSLVVPVVVWAGSSAPTHRVSSILLTDDTRTLVTGSRDGHIVLWHLHLDSYSLYGHSVLLGHTAAVTALCQVNLTTTAADPSPPPTFVSASDNGDLCLWDLQDGRCVESNRLPGQHTNIYRLKTADGSIRVLLHGYYPDIYVVDGSSLLHLYTLSSKLSPDWISALAIARPVNKPGDIVVALTLSGHVKVWALNGVEAKIAYCTEPIYSDLEMVSEDQSKSLRCFNTNFMAICEHNNKLILVLNDQNWQLYDVDDFVLIWDSAGFEAGSDKPPDHVWHRGYFISPQKIVIWTRQGLCLTYSLPQHIRFDPDDEGYRNNKAASSAQQPTLVATFTVPTPEDGGPATEVVTSLCESMAGVVLASGTEEGDVFVHLLDYGSLQQCDPFRIPMMMSSSLEQLWSDMTPSGIIDHLNEPEELAAAAGKRKVRVVTASLYLSQYGNLACGRDDGSIVLVPAVEHAALNILSANHAQALGIPSFFVMRGGHNGRVNCLLYPHQESSRYDVSHFLSGGIDFSVALWDLLTGQLISSFVTHGGQVERLFVTPQACSPRIQQCVVSVGVDHSVCVTSIKERKTVLIASCHLFPVKSIKWRPSHDFMIVHTTDNTLYVWQLETGHLDRVIQGSEVEDVLSACDENEQEVTIRGNLRSAFKRRNVNALRDIALQQINDLTEEKEDGGRSGSTDSSRVGNNLNGLNICPIRLSNSDPFSHILLFDTEALVIELLAADKNCTSILSSEQLTSSNKYVDIQRLENMRRVTQAGQPNIGDVISKVGKNILHNVKKEIQTSGDAIQNFHSKPRSDTETSQSAPASGAEGSASEADDSTGGANAEELTCEVAQLLLSVLYAWDLDKDLDELCVNKLGFLNPAEGICFGVSSRPGFMTLNLPTKSPVRERHWTMSHSITTQHRLAIVALSNALMGMNVPLVSHKQRQQQLQTLAASSLAEMRQGWSSVAALHCILFHDYIAPAAYKRPDLEQLARKWQDRCLQVREAAQALFLAEIRSIGEEGRRDLVYRWAGHLPIYGNDPQPSATVTSPAAAVGGAGTGGHVSGYTQHEDYDEELLGSNSGSGSTVGGGSHKSSGTHMQSLLSRHESQKRQGTAIVMLGLIGAEFGQEIMAGQEGGGSGGGRLEGFGGNNTFLARHTCQALVFLLLHPPPDKQHAEIRRAAIHLIGRGFSVWQPYMDVSRVLLALLELTTDSHIHSQSLMSGMPLNAESDSFQTAMYSLTQIATSHPSVFITSLAREIARYSALSASAPSQTAVSNLPSAVLSRAKTEILRIVEILMETMQKDVEQLLLETMDIVFHCLDPSVVKTRGLRDAFPPSAKFLAVDHCGHTKRIAAGGRRHTIHIYDSRILRPQVVQGPDEAAAVSALCFSPDGKLLATFSAEACKLYFWQAGSTLFNMIAAPSYRCVKFCPSPRLDAVEGRVIRGRQFPTSKLVIIMLSDGTEFRFTFT